MKQKRILKWFFVQIISPLLAIFIPPLILIICKNEFKYDTYLSNLLIFFTFMSLSVYFRLENTVWEIIHHPEIRYNTDKIIKKKILNAQRIRDVIATVYWCPLVLYGIFYTINEISGKGESKNILNNINIILFYFILAVTIGLAAYFTYVLKTLYSISNIAINNNTVRPIRQK